MSELLTSATCFGRGIIRRFYWWLSTFLLNPWDVYEKFIRDLLPARLRVDWPVGGSASGYVFVAGLFVSAFLTYHELRLAKLEAEGRARSTRATDQALRQLSRLRSLAVQKLWANHVSDDEFERTWLPGHERWEEIVERHLRARFGATFADRFRDLGQLPGKTLVANGRYNQRLNMLDKELGIIDEALRQAAQAKL